MNPRSSRTPILGSGRPFLPRFHFSTLFFLSMLIATASPLSFNLTGKGCNQTTPGIICQGDAFSNSNPGVQLTKNQIDSSLGNSVGRAVYSEPLLLWDSDTRELTDFTTHFSFTIYSTDASNSGDGLAFFLSPYPSTIPPSSAGGCLGLCNGTTKYNTSADPIIAVEFDTYPNPEWDPTSAHVGIDINSIKSVKNVIWITNMTDNRTANAWVSYNSSTQNLSVFLTYIDNPVFSGNSSLSYIVDLRKFLPETVAMGFSAATGSSIEVHTILSWDFSSTLEARKKKSKVWLVVVLVVGVGVLMAVSGLVWFILWRKKARRLADEEGYDVSIDDEFEQGRGPKRFPFGELVSATRNFAEEGKLGEGGFGAVYKGFLSDLKLEVAIKRVSRSSKQGKKEYVSEVRIISRLRHRNLVQLIGWCHERGDFLLVYEFMPNGSLDSHLYGEKRLLAWPESYKIALGLASALLYLHEEWEQCVVHRDVKPSNVMLDSAFNAKLGDFGLARFVDHDLGSQTTVLAGTMGYLAPECVTTGKASKESDVYSFGVVALEIACGRRPVEPKEKPERVRLVQWIWGLYGRRMILEAADERLNMEFEEQQMERLIIVGLWCAHPDYNLRPSIRQAIAVLNFESPLPDLPPQMPVPMYFAPPVDGFTYTSSQASSGSGYPTTSSNSTMSHASSSSTSRLLKPDETDL